MTIDNTINDHIRVIGKMWLNKLNSTQSRHKQGCAGGSGLDQECFTKLGWKILTSGEDSLGKSE